MTKNKIGTSMAFVLVFFLVAACAKVEYQTPVLEDPENITEKNYELNTAQQVAAGEKMMEAKDFWATVTVHQKMRALNDFRIEGPEVTHSGSKGDLYNVILKTDVNKQIAYFIEIPGAFRRYGIKESGEWQNSVFFSGQTQGGKTPITPEDAKFEPFEITRIHNVDASKPFTWFEIIFTGTSRGAINLAYREYAPDSMESPAVQEKLSYPIDTEIIRYESIEIKVHEVTDDRISYTVLADGL